MAPSRAEDYDAVRLQVIRQRWDQKADRWDADLADECCHLNQDDAYRRFLDAADSVVAAREAFCRDRPLVDLACGTGLVLARFAERFDRALGVDISPRMLAAAAARRLPRVELLEASCFELAGPATRSTGYPGCPVGPAGAVLSRGILLSHYGDRWVAPLLAQVREILSPDGGFAILDFLNALTRHDYPANPDNKTYYTAEQIRCQADEAGFRRSSILGEPNRRVLLLLAEK
jgi:SAM-dependent methyltransferase